MGSECCSFNISDSCAGISLVGEMVADSEPDQPQQELTEGLQFAYTVPATDAPSQPQDVSKGAWLYPSSPQAYLELLLSRM